MKNIICVFFGLLMLVSCARKDGLYPADKGWDCVYQSQEYRFRIEPDGVFLYAPTDMGDGFRMEAFHRMEGRSLSDCTYLYLRFKYVNDKNEYVYSDNYDHITSNYRGIPIQVVTFDMGKESHFGVFTKDYPSVILLDRYLNSR